MSKRRLTAALVVVGIGCAVSLIWRHYNVTLPFDSAQWRSGDRTLRYRMKDDLRRRVDAGEFATLQSVDEKLGPAEEKYDGDVVNETHYRVYSMRSPAGSPWYVHVRADKSGKVIMVLITAS